MTSSWSPLEPSVPPTEGGGPSTTAPGWGAAGTVLPAAGGRGPRSYLLGALAAAVGTVLVVGVVAGVLGGSRSATSDSRGAFVARPLAAPGSSCTTDPAVARDEQGRLYLEAVRAAEPAWEAVTATLRAEGGQVHHDDLVAQAAADRVFLGGLGRVPFGGAGQEPGGRLVARVQEYVALLDTSAAQVGYFSAHHVDAERLAEARAEASASLRRALGLPASSCDVLRP